MFRKYSESGDKENIYSDLSESDSSESELSELNEEEKEFELFVSFLKETNFFGILPGVGAVGLVETSHFNESEKELHDLIDKIITLAKNNDFTERNQSYLDLLKQVELNLTAHPENINSRDENFLVTPMHSASGAGLFELVKVLMKYNPDLGLKNCFDQTASERARLYAKREDIADFIDSMSPVKSFSLSK